MTVDRIVMLVLGSLVLLSLLLSLFWSQWWLLLALFAGAHLIQIAITGFCPLASALKAVGLRPSSAFKAGGTSERGQRAST
jgi:hypothetical protein